MAANESSWVQLLAFEAGGQPYVLDVMRVRELVRSMPLMPTPGVPPWVLGQMVLRGEVMPVISLARCAQEAFVAPPHPLGSDAAGHVPGSENLGAAQAATVPGHSAPLAWAPQILVVDASGHRFGLLVDRVREVLRLAPEALWPDRAPAGLRSPLCFGLCEIRGQAHMLLDVRPLIRVAAWAL